MFGKVELLVDFGSKKIAIYKRGKGLVLKEPSIIIATNSNNKLELVAAGRDAVAMIGKTSITQKDISPIKEGMVDNDKACRLMITDYIAKIVPLSLLRPSISVIALISCGLTPSEKRNVEEVFIAAGANEVVLVESPLAVAANGNGAEFVVDIGGNKTEIAIVNDNAIIAGCSIDVGGDDFNRAITDFIADKYRMIIHHYTAEKVKISLATMRENDISQIAVTAKSILDGGEAKNIKLNAKEIRESITPLVDKIVQVIEDVSMMMPESLAEAVYNKGITLCGGSAVIPWLDKYISARTQLTVNLCNAPEEEAVNGGAILLGDRNLLTKLINA